MKWRLSLDLGTNSLGWSAFTWDAGIDRPEWQDMQLLDCGVRIFPDSREPAAAGRVGEPLAVARRMARGMRRNRDRGRHRIGHLEMLLVEYGLLPRDRQERAALKSLEPLQLRNDALARPLTPPELGRALLHLGKRRGFKSNRKDSTDEKEQGRIKGGIIALDQELDGRTLGQFLWQKRQQQLDHDKERLAGQKLSLRFRADSEIFPARNHIEQEFAAIREMQADHHDLEAQAWDDIRDSGILFQWPLKSPPRGACGLRPELTRHWKDSPVAHLFRIYTEVTNLRWVSPEQQRLRLDMQQQQAIVQVLLETKTSKTWKSLSNLKGPDKKRLFPREGHFSHDDGTRKGLNGHRLHAMMMDDPVLRPLLAGDMPGRLDDIVECLHEETDPDKLHDRLTSEFDLPDGQARALAGLHLAPGTVQLSRQVMEELIPFMRDQGLQYDDAVTQLTDSDGKALHHSDHRPGELLDQLPYYGEILRETVTGGDARLPAIDNPEGHFGKIANPTVHVALNQLRKLVNALMDRFGTAPDSIHLEIGRDLKNGPKAVEDIQRNIKANTKENDRRAGLWTEWTGGAKPRVRDLLKIKLWEELGRDQLARRCPFSGKNISGQHLINGEVEIEHILPFSRSYDNSKTNLTLAFTRYNRLKGNKTPYEAFSADEAQWEIIQENLHQLPQSKRWRFAEDAMERFNRGEKSGEAAFLARQLTDNAFIARAARRYMGHVCPKVVSIPGGMTALLRGKWGLNGLLGDHNFKERNDHRHHVIDAFVVGLSGQGLLQDMAKASKRGADDLFNLEVPALPDDLRNAFTDRIHTVIAAHKQDHGRGGAFFNETAYGRIGDGTGDPALDGYDLVTRKPVTSLSHKELAAIRDPIWRQKIQQYLDGRGYFDIGKGKKQDDARAKLLTEFGKANRLRRLRILVSNSTAVKINSVDNKYYAAASYACCDIWLLPPEKKGKQKAIPVYWTYVEISDPEKGEPQHRKPHPAAKFVMRLFKQDLVSIEDGGEVRVMRIKGFSATNAILDVVPVNESDPQRKFVSVSTLLTMNLRKLAITPDGRVRGLPKGLSRQIET